MTRSKLLTIALLISFVTSLGLYAQNALPAGGTLVQPGAAQYSLTPISTSVAVNNQATLTIPAPPAGMYNYVCKIVFRISQDATATAVNNAVTTSTNFNSFAFAASSEDVAQKESISAMDFGNPATGCAKSTAPGTATTFVGPAGITNAGQSWQGAYYQAP